jgi:hypothetical protein
MKPIEEISIRIGKIVTPLKGRFFQLFKQDGM